jgi:hypothetical protein
LLFAYGVDRRDIDLGIAQEALAELDVTGILASYDAEAVEAAVATSVSVAETEEALRIADEVRKKEQALAQRERQLAQREQAIAAQQRVLEEETRLLETSRRLASASTPMFNPAAVAVTAPRAVGAMSARAVSPLVNTFATTAPAPAVRMMPDTGIRVQPYEPPTPIPTVWERVRRALVGAFSAQPGA